MYAPLFQYIVQQEYVRHLAPELKIHEYPIIFLSRKTEKTDSQEVQRILQKKDLLSVKEKINFGLAPQNLLVLLNVFEMANHNISRVSEEERLNIELLLRSEIIEGYLKYNPELQ